MKTVAPPAKPIDVPPVVPPHPVNSNVAADPPVTPPVTPPVVPPVVPVVVPTAPMDPACKAAEESAAKAAGLVKGGATCESARRAALNAKAACVKETSRAAALEALSATVEKACVDAAIAACTTASGEYAATVEVSGKKPDCTRLKALRKESEEKCSIKSGVPESYRTPLVALNAKADKELCPPKKTEPAKIPDGVEVATSACSDCLDKWGWAKADAGILWGEECKKKLAPFLKGGKWYNNCKACPNYLKAIGEAPPCPKEKPATGW